MYHSVRRNKKFVFTRGGVWYFLRCFSNWFEWGALFWRTSPAQPRANFVEQEQKNALSPCLAHSSSARRGGRLARFASVMRSFRRYCSSRSPTGSVGSATSLSAKPVRNSAHPFLFSRDGRRTSRTFAPAPGRTERPVTGRPFSMALKVSSHPLKRSSFSGSLLVASRGST